MSDQPSHQPLPVPLQRTAGGTLGTTMVTADELARMVAEASELRRHLARERALLREQCEQRLARSRELLRLSGDLLVVLAREGGAEGGRYRT